MEVVVVVEVVGVAAARHLHRLHLVRRVLPRLQRLHRRLRLLVVHLRQQRVARELRLLAHPREVIAAAPLPIPAREPPLGHREPRRLDHDRRLLHGHLIDLFVGLLRVLLLGVHVLRRSAHHRQPAEGGLVGDAGHADRAPPRREEFGDSLREGGAVGGEWEGSAVGRRGSVAAPMRWRALGSGVTREWGRSG